KTAGRRPARKRPIIGAKRSARRCVGRVGRARGGLAWSVAAALSGPLPGEKSANNGRGRPRTGVRHNAAPLLSGVIMSSPASSEGEKILVVDDDARLRRLLERFLAEQGYRVRAVENAEQMDRLLARELFHLVVLDLMLPGEDGLSVCRRL